MSKKNKHWQEREAIKDNIKRDKELTKEINKRLDVLMKDIETEINRELQAYAKGQNIDLEEVYQRINEMDVKAFEKKAKEYVKNKDFSATANYELKIYNRRMRINRLEWIKSMLGIELVNGFDDIEKILDEYFKDSAKREMMKQAGILGDTVMSNYSEVIEKVVNGSFHNATFSKRIWQYQEELKAELDKLLSRQMVNGHNPRRVARDLRKEFDVTKFESERMMRTESARIQGELQKSSYERFEVKEYEWVTEPTACSVCKDIARGGRYKVKDMEIGINMIPAHPDCRCSTVPVSDREEMLKDFERRGL
ncbi:minor capsid protein [Vagococcus carniphilus]|uniref:minor capsid protein n=1 Tax=Vagococcus carniphilus TaxID=218144 RepID=UPI002891B9E7|nr:minor capsid protein [Vagococcus carniphilus]MDT2864682.1 minor capsid protein [Vagococcus carniphilus]